MHWLKICTDLKNRGVKEILIAWMDGLKGLPEAIKTIFPTDESLNKCIYLATMEIIEKWTQPTPDWGRTLAELSIVFTKNNKLLLKKLNFQ